MLETTVNEVRYAQRLLLLAVHLALYVAKSLGKEPSILMIDGVVRWMLPFFCFNEVSKSTRAASLTYSRMNEAGMEHHAQNNDGPHSIHCATRMSARDLERCQPAKAIARSRTRMRNLDDAHR